MQYDYALVHVKYTIPLAALLTLLYRPLFTRLDVVRITALIFIAVTATIPWDSYLIRTSVWTYPPNGVLGYSLFAIPAEELFFFVIQTYITSLVYIMCNKPVLQAQYLSSPATRPKWMSLGTVLGQVTLSCLTAVGWYLIFQQREGTYLGLILAWACPFAFLTWSLSADMLLAMPWISSIVPIAAPTIYLWVVDELSLRSGIWTIEEGSKLSNFLFGHLDIEEAIFFLMTNILIVFGLAAFDRAVALCDAFPEEFPEPADDLPWRTLVRARVTSSDSLDMKRIAGIKEAVTRLRKKSRSFFLASSVFPGRLRINLTLLYSYCRLADDLVDNGSTAEAEQWISKLRQFLDLTYDNGSLNEVREFISSNFPPSARSALELLPTNALRSEPLYALLKGFETDLQFESSDKWPIHDERDLDLYSSRVASTVGGLCLDLALHHTGSTENKAVLHHAAHEMGIALQYVNIARDIAVDADMGRVYIPETWLEDEGLTPESILDQPGGKQSAAVERLRMRLLSRAFDKYTASRPKMELLPKDVRGPMIAAVESYMEIGRVLREGGKRTEGRATVPRGRRFEILRKTMMAG